MSLDASSFSQTFDTNIYFSDFKKIQYLLVYCYEKIKKNHTKIRKEDHPKKKLENYIRDLFLSELRKEKGKYNLSYLSFISEPNEENINGVFEGFVDIKVGNIGMNVSPSCDENKYYSFECKRISKEKVGEYVNSGINRYVKNIYSFMMPIAGMIGFIEKDNLNEIVKEINKKLKNHSSIKTTKFIEISDLDVNKNNLPLIFRKTKKLISKVISFFKSSGNLYKNPPNVFSSSHGRLNNSIILLYHNFFDFRNIIVLASYKK